MTQAQFNQIMILTDNLFNVVEVEDQFWIVQDFETSISTGSIGLIDYNSFSGICITELINLQKIQTIEKSAQLAFLQQVNTFISNKSYVHVKFSKYARFFYYSKN